MQNTGITRNLDDLGRIVIPKELRRTLNISAGDPVEIFANGNEIVLRRHNQQCAFCADLNAESHTVHNDVHVCPKCIVALTKK